MPLFANPMHEEFASWALAYVGTDGADVGELTAIAQSMAGTDDVAFYDAWHGAAQRHVAAGREAEEAHHPATARHHFLRAAVCAGVSYRPFYGAPVDPRLTTAFDTQMDAFRRAMALTDPPGEELSIPFAGQPMLAYFLPATGSAEGQQRPLVITNNGYDATVVDMYFAMGRQTIERGYHCLLVDGPGQGAMLVRHGVAMVPDWERVISAVVDVAIARPDVDAARIVLQGWSLGGHLALRAATAEHRLAACVSDPPFMGVLDGVIAMAALMGLSPEATTKLPEISDADQDTMMAVIEQVPGLHWKIVQRGFWVNGVPDLRGYLRVAAEFTLEGRIDGIRCPVLGAVAETDMLAANAQDVLDRIAAPTTLLRFTAAEGAGDHCEMQNRALLETQVLDWLDDTLR